MRSNAERYQWLKDHCLEIVPADRDGPEYPQLRFSWGIFTWYRSKQNLKDMLDKEIDKRMDTST